MIIYSASRKSRRTFTVGVESFLIKAEKEGRNIIEAEIEYQAQHSYDISASLLKDKLLMPAEKKKENLHWLILHVQFANGKKFIGLFTDQ